jgi:hypothetical protein
MFAGKSLRGRFSAVGRVAVGDVGGRDRGYLVQPDPEFRCDVLRVVDKPVAVFGAGDAPY